MTNFKASLYISGKKIFCTLSNNVKFFTFHVNPFVFCTILSIFVNTMIYVNHAISTCQIQTKSQPFTLWNWYIRTHNTSLFNSHQTKFTMKLLVITLLFTLAVASQVWFFFISSSLTWILGFYALQSNLISSLRTLKMQNIRDLLEVLGLLESCITIGNALSFCWSMLIINNLKYIIELF